jgi:hypothetical protein
MRLFHLSQPLKSDGRNEEVSQIHFWIGLGNETTSVRSKSRNLRCLGTGWCLLESGQGE